MGKRELNEWIAALSPEDKDKVIRQMIADLFYNCEPMSQAELQTYLDSEAKKCYDKMPETAEDVESDDSSEDESSGD